MPQIFTASADTRLRALFAIGAVCLTAAGVFGGGLADSSYATGVGWVKDQPVPFSHQHHVGELGIDCRYCHTSVEESAQAGLPPTHVCMTCHSEIWTGAALLEPIRHSFATGIPIAWNRVAAVPDYVYFDHSIHVARGVPCVECHGRVDQMPLMARAKPFQMQWCLDCHRDPSPHLRPPEAVTRMDWSDWDKDPQAHEEYGALMAKAYGLKPAELVQCNTCHR